MDSILITAVGNNGTGSQIVECLSLVDNRDYYLIGTDIISCNIHCRDKLDAFYCIPRTTDSCFKNVIEMIILRHRVSIMFLGSINEAIWYYNHKDYFDRHGITAVLGTAELFNLCMDKSELYMFLRNKGIAVPRFKRIIELADCNDIDYYPVVIKPNKYAIASNRVAVAFDKQDLYLLSEYAIKHNHDMIAQEWKGNSSQEYSISVTSDLQGNNCGSIAIKRDFSSTISKKILYRFNGSEFIISSGITQGEVVTNEALLKQAVQIAAELDSKGPLNIQGIWHNETLWIIDAHPAITSGAYARALAGYNEPAFWAELLLYNNKIQLNSANIRISKRILTEVEDNENI